MFNRNGSKNGAHEDAAAVASRNGNSQRPDAAIAARHELLWDGLSPSVTEALGQPLDPALVSQRKGRKGRVYDYLEGHLVIAQANDIFGFGGWGYELIGDVTLRQFETVNGETGEVKLTSAYSAPVRVIVPGAPSRTDIGFSWVAGDTADDHETACKAAVTDGMKRAFRSFGNRFGNGLYGDQPSANAPQQEQVPAPSQARSSRNGRAGQAKGGNRSQAQSRSDSQVEKLHKRLFEIATEQGLDEEQVRTAVEKRTGKGLDDLTAAELGPLVEAAANKLKQMQQEQATQAA